jgi:hypothetical protein
MEGTIGRGEGGFLERLGEGWNLGCIYVALGGVTC